MEGGALRCRLVAHGTAEAACAAQRPQAVPPAPLLAGCKPLTRPHSGAARSVDPDAIRSAMKAASLSATHTVRRHCEPSHCHCFRQDRRRAQKSRAQDTSAKVGGCRNIYNNPRWDYSAPSGCAVKGAPTGRCSRATNNKHHHSHSPPSHTAGVHGCSATRRSHIITIRHTHIGHLRRRGECRASSVWPRSPFSCASSRATQTHRISWTPGRRNGAWRRRSSLR